MFPSIMSSCLCPEAAKQPHSIALPPPCSQSKVMTNLLLVLISPLSSRCHFHLCLDNWSLLSSLLRCDFLDELSSWSWTFGRSAMSRKVHYNSKSSPLIQSWWIIIMLHNELYSNTLHRKVETLFINSICDTKTKLFVYLSCINSPSDFYLS